MTLRLSVVSDQGTSLGTARTKEFGEAGGSIGRGADNEWILPDPERYLSGKHVRIDWRSNCFVIVDLSTNGTFINGARTALGKHHEHVLNDGDRLRVGEYDLSVEIVKGGSRKLSSVPTGLRAKASRTATAPKLADARGAATPAVAVTVTGVTAPVLAVPGVAAPASNADSTSWHLMTRPFKARLREAAKLASMTQDVESTPGEPLAPYPELPATHGELEAGLVAFCRGAGVDPKTLTSEARTAALHLAGQLLREAVVGLMDLNQTQREFNSRFRIKEPAGEATESPLDLTRGVEEALLRLLSMQSTRAGSVEAVRQSFRELKAQNAATTTAIRAAFEDFLDRVDPKELEGRFNRTSKRGVFGAQSKSKYWDYYTELFPGLAQRPDDGFPHTFVEAFAKAYQTRLRTLVPPRRSAFGTDKNGDA